MRTIPKSVIRTAVFPVAGRGTRFLPATKASPKEMLPVVDKPLIQYAVEEALQAGARRLVFITGAAKRAIEDHFDSDQELEHMLESQGKSDLLNQLRSVLPSYASCIYIRQPAPLGLGHAVLCAQPAVGAEPFFVHLADDLIRSDVACLAQMAEVYEAKRASVLGVQLVPRQDTEKYGIVAVEADKSPTSRVRSIIEKPKPSVAPSNLAVVGRYVLAPSIFEHLEKLGQGAGGEIQLTDGIAALMREEAVYAHRFTGKRYDCGSKLGYLQATVEYALAHPALGKEFRKYLQHLNLTTVSSKNDLSVKQRAAPAGSGGRRRMNGQSQNGSGSGKRANTRRKSGRPSQPA
ncbi:MAG: UTP--glucose-phosphate uridylyltransferase [Gammaproteobacteria bacterium]|jgi:UTP--glucose-1-phosphate uridylyltransferase|nr:UTP--glucose-phosphate uridylyltransferase [Gammaproteobacteria bacterium]